MQKNNQVAKVLTTSVLVLGLVSIATMASAAVGIKDTRHNLGSSNRDANGQTVPPNPWNEDTGTGITTMGDQWTNATDEICVFCHTPHGAAPTGWVNAPLWNRVATSTAAYTVYKSGTMQGTAGVTAGSMSVACLSCHDGTQAMDTMINKPGASGFSMTGSRMSGNGLFMWYSGNAGLVSGTGGLGDGFILAADEMPTGTNWSPVLLGTDLSNDHPIGMAYCGGGQTGTASISGCTDTDFNPQMSGANGSFFVGSSPSQRENMRTYGSSPATATVECGSCHDPHNALQRTFLRTSNAGSKVCMTCHIK